MNIKSLSGYSTALFSSWYFLEELGILFDCGDGVTAHLLAKTRKIKYIFISHPDRDHITGLGQLLQLNARDGFPKIYYPKDSGSFPAMKDFLAKFDPHVSGCEWIPISSGQEISINKKLKVLAFRNEHVPCDPEVVKSLSFKVFSTKKKLKEEYLGCSGEQIKALKLERGEDQLFDIHSENIITYSGDTPIAPAEMWNGSKILIHEATFLDKTLLNNSNIKKRNEHSTLKEVIAMVANSNIGHLVLGHFSTRYNHAELKEEINRLLVEYKISIPVSIVLPGQCEMNVLEKNQILP